LADPGPDCGIMSAMTDENQIQIPASFIALFVPRGRIKPIESRETIAERYDFCEDLASLMTEHAKATLFDLGIAESDVLVRCHLGLLTEAAPVSEAEAGWVVRRLAELLEWECPPGIGQPPAAR
jgi:hypothetical protein